MDNITKTEREEIRKIFGVSVEEIDKEKLVKLKKELRAKYHPDNFEKFEDEVVKQMATERFQRIEELSKKVEMSLSGEMRINEPAEDFMKADARFAGNKLKVEIVTTEKDLKYQLFGTKYRWLVYGDKFDIPDTKKASIIIDEDHKGRKIGFVESIKMYLTFGEEDAIEDIVDWFFDKIIGKTKSLLIAGKMVPMNRMAIENAIKQKTFLRLAANTKTAENDSDESE